MDAATLAVAKAYSNKRLNWRGAWAATTAYAKNDLVTYNGGLYRAPAAFTSGASFTKVNWIELVSQSGTNVLSNPTVTNIVRDSNGRILSLTEDGVSVSLTRSNGKIATVTINGTTKIVSRNSSGRIVGVA